MVSDFGHPMTRGERGVKKVKFLQTSFMDGPQSKRKVKNMVHMRSDVRDNSSSPFYHINQTFHGMGSSFQVSISD